MKSIKTFSIAIVFIFLANIANSQNLDGWFKAGSKPDAYEIGLSDEKYNEKPVYYIKSIETVSGKFGTIMTNILPDKYSGKRVRLSGYIKTKDSDNYAGMWMRVDGNDPNKSLAFDNMYNRPIKGTNDWQKYEIVLDVDTSSVNIAYGVLINGSGQVWLSELSFEVVGTDVPVTNN